MLLPSLEHISLEGRPRRAAAAAPPPPQQREHPVPRAHTLGALGRARLERRRRGAEPGLLAPRGLQVERGRGTPARELGDLAAGPGVLSLFLVLLLIVIIVLALLVAAGVVEAERCCRRGEVDGRVRRHEQRGPAGAPRVAARRGDGVLVAAAVDPDGGHLAHEVAGWVGRGGRAWRDLAVATALVAVVVVVLLLSHGREVPVGPRRRRRRDELAAALGPPLLVLLHSEPPGPALALAFPSAGPCPLLPSGLLLCGVQGFRLAEDGPPLLLRAEQRVVALAGEVAVYEAVVPLAQEEPLALGVEGGLVVRYIPGGRLVLVAPDRLDGLWGGCGAGSITSAAAPVQQHRPAPRAPGLPARVVKLGLARPAALALLALWLGGGGPGCVAQAEGVVAVQAPPGHGEAVDCVA